MESTHDIIERVQDGTIDGDEAIRILMPNYAPEVEFVPTIDSVEQYMHDSMAEMGRFPEEFTDFALCEGSDDYPGCHKLLVWDNETEDFRHLVRSECYWMKYDREGEPAAAQG